ncbi:hypothetical protein EYF80_065658 [Liparis tanakae]|uniref:Uncharacterized protein n=1 Tax=Liparis tanakae TaxID=230148 RepID=A0A4Z2E602_9TELE|nr:hypothetical protein EYF80_065658 [Liparis tanakae]
MGDSSPAGVADGTAPDPNSCKPPPSPDSLSDPSSGLPAAGLSAADLAAAVGVGGGEPLVGDALLKAKPAMSVLGLAAAAGRDGIGPPLRFCVESADKKGGGDCAVGRAAAAAALLPPGGAAFVVACRSVAVAALMGTSLRPPGGRGGQNLAPCLVGGGEESRGGSTRGNEEEEPMTVWASVAGWRTERRKPSRRRAMVGLGSGERRRRRVTPSPTLPRRNTFKYNKSLMLESRQNTVS